MLISALGVTGGTGKHFVEQALAAGHSVVAVARRPDAVGISHSNLKVVGAQVSDMERLTEAFRGSDAVVSMLGVTSLLQARKGTTIYSEGTRSIRSAMADAGVDRLVVVSSGGVEPQPNDNWFYTNVLKRFFLAPIYRDMVIMEREVRESAIRWTIVRPPYLTGDQHRTDYRTQLDGPIPDDDVLSRWSLAHFLLSTVVTPEPWQRHVVSISY